VRSTTNTSCDTATWITEHDPLPVICVDESTDAIGFDPRGAYVETYWLAVLGPSSIVVLRRLRDWLDDRPSGIVVALEDIGQSLGLGSGTGRSSLIVRTLDRLVNFEIAQIAWDAYALQRTIPPLPPRLQRRLPVYLAERHDHDLHSLAADAAGVSREVPVRY
jgi:hypothetical protein